MEVLDSNPTIVKRVDIPATLQAIQPGTSAKFRARSFAPYSSVRSAISRLNDGKEIFTATTNDNGESFIITHNNV